MNEFRLRVGNMVLSLEFQNQKECRAIGRYFNRPATDESADLSLSLRFRNDIARQTTVPSSLFLTKTGNGNGFSMAGGLVEGRFSPSSGEGDLLVQRLLTKGGYARIFEQVFYQAYWSAVKRRGADSFLLHSSGVIHDGRGYAFTGKSGSGKSTVAAMSSDKTILNDEITVINLSGSSPTIMDTPFNGFFRSKKEGTAALAGIMLLKQAPCHRLTRAIGVEPVKTLSREIIPPMGLETPFSQAVYMDMFDLAEKARLKVPLFSMEFQKDPGFWARIDELGGV